MSRRSVIIWVMVVMAGATAAGAIAARGAAATGPDAPLRRQFTLQILFLHDKTIDAAPSGPSQGDEFIFDDALVGATGADAGQLGGTCITTSFTGLVASCQVTFLLLDGSITAQFLNAPPPVKIAAITGGTGMYEGVGGHARLVEHLDQTGTVTFFLSG